MLAFWRAFIFKKMEILEKINNFQEMLPLIKLKHAFIKLRRVPHVKLVYQTQQQLADLHQGKILKRRTLERWNAWIQRRFR